MKIGFWNYVTAGEIDAEHSVDDWTALGMNLAMSCEAETQQDREYLLKNLYAAEKLGIKIIVCDRRLRWKKLTENGADQYRADVLDAVKTFASHPAFYAFHIGDEPNREAWADMMAAVKIVREYARPFVNFFPFFEEDFGAWLKTNHDGYADMLVKTVKETGLDMLCYDCYTQLFEHEREDGIENYFYNLNRFYKAAKDSGVEMWTTLLSVGHWRYRVPNEDDLRWQISTAAAHGAKGILWFYIYGRLLESNYRLSPFDQYYEKTETFGRLARQNKLFRDYFAERLTRSELLEIWHVGKSYGGTPLYTPECIKGLSFVRKYSVPMIISKFLDAEGKVFLLFVNNSQTDIEEITLEYGGEKRMMRFAQGQMKIVEYKE